MFNYVILYTSNVLCMFSYKRRKLSKVIADPKYTLYIIGIYCKYPLEITCLPYIFFVVFHRDLHRDLHHDLHRIPHRILPLLPLFFFFYGLLYTHCHPQVRLFA